MSDAKEIENPVLPIDLEKYDDMSVGEILRKTREHYGQTLAEVEGDLRIRIGQLQALEKLDLDKLPGRVYAIGFVRAYSEYLGLDGNKMVQLFKAQSVGKRKKPNLKFPVTYDENNTPNLFVILLSLVGTILLISYWVMFHAPTQYREAIPPVPAFLQKSQVDVVAATIPEKVELFEQPEIVAEQNVMALHIVQDSWVEVKNAQGEKLLSQVLKSGDKYIVSDEAGLTLTTGNAGGVKVVIDGEDKGLIGEPTKVMRNISLSRDFFDANE